MKKYIINDKERFTEMFRRENLCEDKISSLLSMLNPALNISVILETENGITYQKIIDNTNNKRIAEENFNAYEKSLISECFNNYLGFKNNVNKEFIKVLECK